MSIKLTPQAITKYIQSKSILDRQEDITRFLDELFSQSVYYVSPSGSALRLKTFEIKSKGELAGVIQPTTEQISIMTKWLIIQIKKVIQVSDVVPEQENLF